MRLLASGNTTFSVFTSAIVNGVIGVFTVAQFAINGMEYAWCDCTYESSNRPRLESRRHVDISRSRDIVNTT
jgi:hypothetical protein